MNDDRPLFVPPLPLWHGTPDDAELLRLLTEAVALLGYFGDHGGGERVCHGRRVCPQCSANVLGSDLRRALGGSGV